MLEENFDLLTALEIDHLRGEALMRYEQCLVDKGTKHLAHFIEEHVSYNPPPLFLLERIANDLQQRLFTLQLHQYEVRNHIIGTMLETYGIDITHLAPANQLARFHLLAPIDILNTLPTDLPIQERSILHQTLETSRQLASQLQADIDLTNELVDMVTEWTTALSTRYARESRDWHFGIAANFSDDIIH